MLLLSSDRHRTATTTPQGKSGRERKGKGAVCHFEEAILFRLISSHLANLSRNSCAPESNMRVFLVTVKNTLYISASLHAAKTKMIEMIK